MKIPLPRLKLSAAFLAIVLLIPLAAFSQTAESRHREVQAHLERAQQALQVSDPDTAVREYQAALGIEPRNVDARSNLGVIAFMQGHFSEAAKNFREALAIQPSLWKVQALLGMSEKRIGHLDSARTQLEKAFPHLEEPKLRTQAGLELAELEYQVGELGKSIDVTNRLLRLDPGNTDVLYAAYRTYTDLAGSTLNALALLAPDGDRMHLIIAEHLINEGDRDGAIAQYKKVLEISPRMPGVHFELGEALLQSAKTLKERGEAEDAFKAELAINPNDVSTVCRLGDLYLSAGGMDLDAAYKSYARALELQPGLATAQLGMGKVLVRTGKNEEAIAHLREAARLDPVSSTPHYLLAQSYRRLGQTAEADKELALFKDLESSRNKIHEVYQEMHQVRRGEETPEAPEANVSR